MYAILLGFLMMAAAKGQEKKEYQLQEFAASDSLNTQTAMQDTLPEVYVVARRPLVKASVDKTTYNMEEDPDAKVNTLLEMLRKVPLVTVDGDDNVKVNGSSSFRIYMNGKPSNMLSNNPKDVLRSIPAGTIKKVEVITDPGARYDAEGVSGILNIVTKGSEFEGYNVNLQALAMNTVRVFGGYGTMKAGKLSLSANYYYSDYRMTRKSDYDRYQSGMPGEEHLSLRSDTRTKTPGHYGAFEASYELDSLNLVTVSGALDMDRNVTRFDERYVMQDNRQEPVYSYSQATDMREKWGHSSLKTDYQHLFRRNKQEMLTLSYQYDYTPNDVSQYLSLSDLAGTSPSLQYLNPFSRQINHAKGREHTLQLDYVNPFAEMHSLEGGMKYIRRINNSEAVSDKRDSEAEDWSPADFQPAVSYRHVQNILAAYAGYTLSYGNWGMNAGLRMEHTWQEVSYKQGNGSDFDYQATDWVPSFSASRKLGDRQQLRLAYNLRLRRPGIGYLNPYVLLSSGGLRYGNPELVSEKHHRLTLSYSYFGSVVNVQATALYTHSNRGIGEYQFLDQDAVLNKTYGNLERMDGGGITYYMSYSPFPKTSVSLNGMFHYLSIRPEKAYVVLLAGVRNRGVSGSVFLDFSQKLGKGWRLVCSGGWGKPEITIGSTYPDFYYYSCYIGKSFLNEKLTVTLRGQNFLQPYRITESRENYADFHARERSRIYDRSFGVTVSYSLGSLKEKVRKAARSIENDDVKSMKK